MYRPILLALALAAAPITTFAADDPKALLPTGSSYSGEYLTVTAEVVAVDQATREVTLKDERGQEHHFVVGDEVRNLAQVEVGDILVIRHTERLAVKLYPAKAGAIGRVETTERSRAALGQKPYGQVTTHLTISGRVASIDPATRVLVLEGKHGQLNVTAGQDIRLDELKVGDLVTAEYQESIAISVESPQQAGK